MLGVNTNLASLIVQANLRKSTNGLNVAIERMTTGFKINCAKDNAAGYSISMSMSTKLSAYQVAVDNAAMGLDMLVTASDSLSLVSKHLGRVRDLVMQASNGTYGTESINAIQSEIDARIAEIGRIMNNTQYNGIKIFGEAVEQTNVKSLTEEEALAQGYTLIRTADELQAMNDDLNGKYILMNDIDLSGYDWKAIGDYYSDPYETRENPFTGEFNGNCHVIRNLNLKEYFYDEAFSCLGFFKYVDGAEIKNVGLENVFVDSNQSTGALVGKFSSGIITSCYATGSVNGGSDTGGLVGNSWGTITSCYANCSVSGDNNTGGFVGMCSVGTITSCYATGSVAGHGNIGGFVGYANDYHTSTLSNCYFNTETSGQNLGVGTGTYAGDVTGVTSSELKKLIPTLLSNSLSKNNDGMKDILLQVGIDSSENSQLRFNTALSCNLQLDVATESGADNALSTIDALLVKVNHKQVEFGSVQNRLESVLEEINTHYENLISSRSTLRDTDVARESSAYIRNQILQEAAATLLATANQSPALALQLL